MVMGSMVYLSLDQYKESDEAKQLVEDNIDKISETKDYYFFDSEGNDRALIMYTGAKVEPLAYAPMCIGLNEAGIDCFILKEPFNFSLININKADVILKNYDYQEYYLAGHSLGGVCASMHICNHPNEFKGLVLLASYSTKELPSDLKVLCINGSNDEVIQKEKFDESIVNYPTNFTNIVIEGGNHGQFGSYGKQKKDGEASISADEQKDKVVEEIIKLVGE